jgi:putative ABC transport system permease protein
VVRTSGDPSRLAAAARNEVVRLDATLPVGELQPMSAFVDKAMAPTRFALVMIGIFAGVAAILAAVGLYGVLSTVVRQRTAEIGVRMVFGAPRRSIVNLIVGQGLRLSIAGVVLGILGAMAMTRVIASMLVEVKPTDPMTFVMMSLLFCAIAAAASWLPARRAAALDPSVALREE